jgi:acyl-coenzyme A synthetase/AMP-(fatty) acid ligase
VGVAFRADVLDGIGITEMPHIFLSGWPGAVRPGTTGVAVPGYDPRILDNEGNEVVPGTPGMLFMRGDSTATGAAGKPRGIREEERVVLVAG